MVPLNCPCPILEIIWINLKLIIFNLILKIIFQIYNGFQVVQPETENGTLNYRSLDPDQSLFQDQVDQLRQSINVSSNYLPPLVMLGESLIIFLIYYYIWFYTKLLNSMNTQKHGNKENLSIISFCLFTCNLVIWRKT